MLQEFNAKNLKVGLIGLGDHAFEQLLPSLKITSGLELMALSSRTPQKLEMFARKFQPQYTSDRWQDLVDKDLVDAIIVSSSPQLHYEVAKECITKNIHCFIEKPPTQNLQQLEELIVLKKNSSSKTFIGFNFTFSDAYTKLVKALSGSPIKLAKFRFITTKPDTAVDGFATVLESGLYKMFIHPMHTLSKTFGRVKDIQVLDSIFTGNKFNMNVNFTFENGSQAILEWGNYSNRFECKFELTNEMAETGVLDNMGNYELWNLKNHSFDKTFKNKERLVFDNSPLMGGFERTGYQRELELWRDAILDNTKSPCELEDALEVYRVIEMVKQASSIRF